MSTVLITRKTKLGFGYSTAITEFDGDWYIEKPEKPSLTGTITQVLGKIECDKNLQSLNNTFHCIAWFVKVKGGWRRIKKDQYPNHHDLLNKFPDGEYEFNLIELEVEDE